MSLNPCSVGAEEEPLLHQFVAALLTALTSYELRSFIHALPCSAKKTSTLLQAAVA